MSSIAIEKHISPDEYITAERKAIIKSEYIHGEVFAMSGASRAHNLIAVEITTELNLQLRGRGCDVYSNDMRVRTGQSCSYFYPDVVVVCDKPRFQDNVFDTLLNPTLIVEVLSPSTDAFDRGEKFRLYQEVKSLREYLLVSQDRISVEHYQITETQWIGNTYESSEDVLQLNSIKCKLPLHDIYSRVLLTDN